MAKKIQNEFRGAKGRRMPNGEFIKEGSPEMEKLELAEIQRRGGFMLEGTYKMTQHSELILYEVRPRGQFMSDGVIVYAESHADARLIPINCKGIDCVVIKTEPGLDNGEWFLISATGSQLYPQHDTKYKMTIPPYDPDPQKRLIFAKKCEAALQNREENPNTKFSDFDRQMKQFEKEQLFTKSYITIDKRNLYYPIQKQVVVKCAEARKEFALAETATIAGESEKSELLMEAGKRFLKLASRLADGSREPGTTTEPNTAEKSITKTKKQLEMTYQKNKEYRKSTNQKPTRADTLGIDIN